MDGGTALYRPLSRKFYRKTAKMASRRYRSKYRQKGYIPKYLSKQSKRNLKRNLNTLGEKMYVVRSNEVTPAAPTVIDVTNITIGDNDTNRHGDQLGLRSIEVNWLWTLQSDDDVTQICRFIVFQWFPNSVPTADDILINIANPVIAPLSPYQHDTRFNFKILMDVTSTLDREGNSSKTYRRMITSGFKRKVQYVAAGTVGNNEIYVLFLTDSGVIPHPELRYQVKLNYNDY